MTVQVSLPQELLQAAQIEARDVSKLVALELFREGRVSLGRAAELCGAPQAEFMRFADERAVALHYTSADWEQDHQLIGSLP